MSDSGGLRRLREGGETAAEIEVSGADFPWLRGRLRARSGAGSDRVARSDELYGRFNAGPSPVAPDGAAVAGFLLHVDGDETWFRRIDAGPDE